jgi:hypothetical protein
MVLLLFLMALVVGVLIGLGARRLARLDLERANIRHSQQPLSSEATDLGYKVERDYRIDGERAAAALGDVLGDTGGSQRLWENPETGNRGVIWGSGETRRPDGSICRTLARRTLINGAFRNGGSEACHSAGGPWNTSVGWHAE